MKIKKKEQVIEASQGLQQMYQAGYLDCWKKLSKNRMRSVKAWKEYNLACMKGFEKRFIKKINKIRDEVKGGKWGEE